MATGWKDWFRSVDIIQQTLSRLQVRPTYGGARIIDVSGAVSPNTETLILSISGTGMYYGVYFWATSTGTQQNDYIKSIVDGGIIYLPTFKEYNDNNFIILPGAEGAATVYDEVNYRYAGVAGYGKTWESTYKIYYVETHGRTPTAALKFCYALV